LNKSGILNEPGCLKRLVSTILVDCLDRFGRNSKRHFFIEFRDEDRLFLEICLAAVLSGRSKFGSTSTIAVAASNLRALIRNRTHLCHSVRYAIMGDTSMQIETLFIILILILSVVIHEVAHGYAANMQGDPTARLAGRLTLNPIKHIDLLGSLIIPGLLVLSSSPFLFGYAKPVPYNPYNLRNQRWGEAIVAGAGPFTNVLIALFFGLIVRLGTGFAFVTPAFVEIASAVVFINLLLAVINMIPLPPLDGSKVLASLLPFGLAQSYGRLRMMLEGNMFLAFGLVILLVFFFGSTFARFIFFLSSLILGF